MSKQKPKPFKAKRNAFAVHAWNKGHSVEPNKKAKQSKQHCRNNKGVSKDEK